MGHWNDYKYEEPQRLKAGDYRVEIVSASEEVSNSGNPMIVVQLRPNNSRTVIRDYFVKGEFFNQKISRFFDAFPEIEKGNFEFITWTGAIGAARFREDGEYLKVHYYIDPERAAALPEWIGPKPERTTVMDFEELDDAELPF